MKTNLLILLISITFLSANAQIKNVKISESRIASIGAKYAKMINVEKEDTSYYVYLGFQNAKYESITDIKSIMIHSKEDLELLIKDLKLASADMGTKTTISYKSESFSVSVYDFSKELYLEEGKKGSGYTKLNKKSVEKLVIWLESIKFNEG